MQAILNLKENNRKNIKFFLAYAVLWLYINHVIKNNKTKTGEYNYANL